MIKKRSKTIRNRNKGKNMKTKGGAQQGICAVPNGPNGNWSKKQINAGCNKGGRGQQGRQPQNPQQMQQQQLQKLLKQQYQPTGQHPGQITPEQMALLTGQQTIKPGKGQFQMFDPNKKLNNYLRHGTPVEPVRAPGKFTKGETMQKILKRIHKYVKTHKGIKKKVNIHKL